MYFTILPSLFIVENIFFNFIVGVVAPMQVTNPMRAMFLKTMIVISVIGPVPQIPLGVAISISQTYMSVYSPLLIFQILRVAIIATPGIRCRHKYAPLTCCLASAEISMPSLITRSESLKIRHSTNAHVSIVIT